MEDRDGGGVFFLSCSSHCIKVLIGLLGFLCGPSAAGSPGFGHVAAGSLPLSGGLCWVDSILRGRLARQAGAVHDVSVQHLQQQVVQRHHVLHLHAVQVVHAFVATNAKQSQVLDGPVKP